VIELDVVLNKLEEQSRGVDAGLRRKIPAGSDTSYEIGFLQGQSAGLQAGIDIIKRALDDEYAKEVEL
jgi:hypothetical protein